MYCTKFPRTSLHRQCRAKHVPTIWTKAIGCRAPTVRRTYFSLKVLEALACLSESVLGQRCRPTMKNIPEPIDVVDCFRPTRNIPPLAQDAVDIGAKALWMQENW